MCQPTLLGQLRSVLFDSTVVVRECRRCGANLCSDATQCPECGCDGIATYEIE